MKRSLLTLFLIVSVALLAPTPSAQFASGFRDFLRADRDDTTSGELTALALKSDSNAWINYDGPEGDGIIYFYENSSPVGANLRWSDGVAAFEFSHKTVVGDFVSNADARAGSNVYVNYNGGDGDAFLYFYEGASETGVHLKWDDVSARFEVSAAFDVTGDITVTGTVDGIDVAVTAALFDTNYAQITLATVLGAVDLGGATSFELPNSANPTIDAAGEISFDSDENAVRGYDGAAQFVVGQKLRYAEKVIVLPDSVQAYTDAINLLTAEPSWAPFGIEIVSVGASRYNVGVAYAVNFENWGHINADSAATAGVTTIEAVTIASDKSAAEDDGTIGNATIAAGSNISVDLPTTHAVKLTVWATFYIITGN